jgi:hypothetical protein
MSDPKGPRDPDDADDFGAQDGDPARATRGEDEQGDAERGVDERDVPVDDHRPTEHPYPGVAGPEHEWATGRTEWSVGPEDEERDRRQLIPAFLVGALAGIVALGVVWAATAILTDSDSGPAAIVVTRTATVGAKPSLQSSAGPSEEDRCRQADTELAGLLRAAVPAMDQWEIHIGAMNKLVVGAITLQQANAFWNQTRVGAKRNLGRFYSETRRVPFPGAGCPSPDELTEASAELESCAKHVASERHALKAADVAMGTWKKHVRHMEMLRMGMMSPATATRMWLASWRQGDQELQTYRSAERAVKASGSC